MKSNLERELKSGKIKNSPREGEKQNSVACSNKVMDTRLPQPAGCGDKYDVDSSVQYGRSMIEMLGVLAIIAMLSIGGIAGYSKAMDKFKINKIVNEYSFLIAGLMERLPEIQNMTPPKEVNPADKKIGLVDYVKAANLVPATWKKESTLNMYDSAGNYVYIGSRWNRLYINLALGGVIKQSSGASATSNFSAKLCMELIQNLVYPMHSSLHHFTLYKTGGRGYTHIYYGDAYCANNNETETYIQKCLSQTTLNEFNTLCKSCDKTNSQKCYFTIEF